jgi:hypothetical protein
MARSYPSEDVLDALGAALAAISTTAEDSFTPAIVARWGHCRALHEEVPSISYWIDSPTDARAGSIFQSSLGVTVRVVVEFSDDASNPTDMVANKAREDVLRALARGVDWNALPAALTRVGSTTFRDIDEDETDNGAEIYLDFEMEKAFEDPQTTLS